MGIKWYKLWNNGDKNVTIWSNLADTVANEKRVWQSGHWGVVAELTRANRKGEPWIAKVSNYDGYNSEVDESPFSRELAFDTLKEAQAWAEKIIQEMGGENLHGFPSSDELIVLQKLELFL